jgi:hypothetical protein
MISTDQKMKEQSCYLQWNQQSCKKQSWTATEWREIAARVPFRFAEIFPKRRHDQHRPKNEGTKLLSAMESTKLQKAKLDCDRVARRRSLSPIPLCREISRGGGMISTN